jgi:putative FmdB family regulatory protein
MPTYEYICEKCGHEFEIFQPMSARPLQKCPEDRCARRQWGRGKVRKVIGAGAGLIFKGSGFYITDYRSENYKAAAKKEAPAPAGDGKETKPAKPASSSETKPAATTKPESKPAKPAKAKE